MKSEKILIRKGNLKGSGISALQLSFERYPITDKSEIKHYYLIAIDN